MEFQAEWQHFYLPNLQGLQGERQQMYKITKYPSRMRDSENEQSGNKNIKIKLITFPSSMHNNSSLHRKIPFGWKIPGLYCNSFILISEKETLSWASSYLTWIQELISYVCHRTGLDWPMDFPEPLRRIIKYHYTPSCTWCNWNSHFYCWRKMIDHFESCLAVSNKKTLYDYFIPLLDTLLSKDFYDNNHSNFIHSGP